MRIHTWGEGEIYICPHGGRHHYLPVKSEQQNSWHFQSSFKCNMLVILVMCVKKRREMFVVATASNSSTTMKHFSFASPPLQESKYVPIFLATSLSMWGFSWISLICWSCVYTTAETISALVSIFNDYMMALCTEI